MQGADVRPTRIGTRGRLWTCLGVVIGGVCLLTAGALYMGGQEEPLGPGERAGLLDIEYLSEWMEGYVPDLSAEVVTKTAYIDGSYDIFYEYDIPEDPDAPYLSCMIDVEPTEDDAEASYTGIWAGAVGGLWLEDRSVKREALEYSWGDESHCVVLTDDEGPLGNLFITRKGRRIFYLVVSGIYFEDDNFPEFVESKLEQLSTYDL